MCFGSRIAILVAALAAAAAPSSSASARALGRATEVPGIRNAVEVVAGEMRACARMADGGVGCWGEWYARPAPALERVAGLPAAVSLHSGGAFFCAGDRAGALRCWGRPNWLPPHRPGAVNEMWPHWTEPQFVENLGGFAGAVEIAPGCGRRGDGTVSCLGRLDGSRADRLKVAVVPLPTPATALAGNYSQNCAVLSSGAAACWGENNHGQLGRGTVADFAGAAPVTGIDQVRAIASARDHTCALDADGRVWCWGENSHGQLGDGTRVERHAPVRVAGLDTAHPIAIAVTESASCALLASRRVRCWGSNWNGMVGDGTFRDRPTPVDVAGLRDAVELDAGPRFFCARRASGRVACWGGIFGDDRK